MASGQTVVEYNNVRIFQCATLRFEQQEMQDPTHTDTMYHRFTVTVAGMVHGKSVTDFAPKVDPVFVGGGAAFNEDFFRTRLSVPRKDFLMLVGADANGNPGDILLLAKPADFNGQVDSERDVCNGPRCTSINVRRIVSNEIFGVEATFEVCLPVCEDLTNNGEAGRVLSNRWSVTDSVDENFYTTRTWRGRLRLRRKRGA